LTVEEYLEFEKTSETRHEYVDGQLFELAGEKRRHNKLLGRLLNLLSKATDEKSGEMVFNTRIQTAEKRFRYPNITVSLIPGDDEYILANPCFIAEISSHNNQESLLERLYEYTKLSSLQTYTFIVESHRLITVYKREGEKWIVEALDENGEFDVPCLDTKVTLEQLYQGIL
jgi:Uma2 family endonuclease